MNQLSQILCVAIGGALGAVCRLLVNWGVDRWGPSGLPLATLMVNVTGCFALGVIAACMAPRADGGHALFIFLTTGFLGAFTTYSTFALDTLRLYDVQGATLAILNMTLQLTLGLAAARVGGWLGTGLGDWHLP